MEGLIPYLNFDGNTAEALAFYEKALEGNVVFKQTFGDSPMGSKMPDSHKDRIMHATFQAGPFSFMASDGPPGYEMKIGNNISLSLHFSDLDKIDRVYKALSEGGKAIMPMQETYWAKRFGMLIDKYGITWMFNMDK